jgi:hypothetical protein
MAKLLTILFSFCIVLLGNAQSTFSKVKGLPGSSEFGTIVVKTKNGFLATYGDLDETSNAYCLGALALDNDGNVLKKNTFCFGENVIVRYGRSLLLANNNIAHYGTLQQYDTTKKDFTTWTALTLFNDMGDTLWTKQFLDSSKHVVARTLIETPDSGLFLIGDETLGTSNRDPFVIRVDKYGNKLSSHSIAHSGIGAIYSVVKHPNGKYYAGGNGGSRLNPEIYIAELDTNMKPLWSKYYPSGVGHAAFITLLNDGNLLFGSDTLISRHSQTIYTARKQLFKIDTNGTIIWKKIHDEIGESNYYAQLIETKYNDIYALARRKPQEGIHHTLTKLSSAGDTIWMHQYAYEDIEGINYLWDMVATDDGGVLMVGDVTPDGSRYQDVWLVKVDSNGCINNDCAKTLVYGLGVSVKEAKVLGQIGIYPNPSNGNVQLNGLEPNNEYQVSITNIQGQVVFSTKYHVNASLDVSGLIKGVYHISVDLDNKIIANEKLIISE